MQTLIIDNYDSYTFNLYQIIAKVNHKNPIVIANDQVSWEKLQKIAFDNIVISPGPGRPENLRDFGICSQIIKNVNVPLLGVCLGHQGIGYVYGGKIIPAPEVRHGRISKIYHHSSQLFQGIPSPFSVVRYHSLLVADQLPNCLEKIAWTEEGLIMGLRHRDLPLWGVQFHPESISTEYGETLLQNFKKITLEFNHQSLNTRKKHYFTTNKTLISPVDNFHSQKSEKSEKFALHSRKLNIYPDAEQIFFHLFAQATNAFWLDSSLVEPGLSRFSFMGDGNGINSLLIRYHCQNQELIIINADKVTRRRENIFDFLKREIEYRRCYSDDLPFDFNCGFIGYFGYEIKAECGGKSLHSSSLPDAVFLLADRMIVIDHQEHCLYLLQLVQIGQTQPLEIWFKTIEKQLENLTSLPSLIPQGNGKPVKFKLHRCHQNYLDDIHHCLQQIHAGETYQVCLTNQLHTDAKPDPLTFYRVLRQINPAPYSAFLRFGEIAIACSSPERFLKIDRHGLVETKPIKGTLPRGKNPREDFAFREQLRHSEKDKSENLMIVDLLRNDLGKVCQVGTVHVPKLMAIETYATVHQLVTTVRGNLRSDLESVDCIRACFPGGSMTGAPKIRTMEIIDQLEQKSRGVYSGAIGFLGLNGAADLNIVIRTAVFTPDQTSIGVGGGIVALSNPQMEFQEILLKAQALIDAMMVTMNGRSQPDQYHILGMETKINEQDLHQHDMIAECRNQIDNDILPILTS